MPPKKKQITEKQAVQIMTRRRKCIQTYRNKTISFSNPVVTSVKEIPKETKKRTYKKKTPTEPPAEEPVVEKKKRIYTPFHLSNADYI